MARNKLVAVVMGSDSDMPTMQVCIDKLKSFGIGPAVRDYLGSQNAAIFAVQILALSDEKIAEKLTDFRKA